MIQNGGGSLKSTACARFYGSESYLPLDLVREKVVQVIEPVYIFRTQNIVHETTYIFIISQRASEELDGSKPRAETGKESKVRGNRFSYCISSIIRSCSRYIHHTLLVLHR